MRKRLIFTWALVLLATAANSQTIGEVTDSVKQAVKRGNVKEKVSIIKGAFASKAAAAEDLVGTWVYVEPAVLSTSGNLLFKTIGNTYADKLEKLVDQYFEKAKMSAENTSVTFHENGTFSRSVSDKEACGVWMVSGDKIMTAQKNVHTSTLTTHLKNDTLTLVVPINKIMSALQTLGAFSDSKTNNTLVKLSKHLSGMQAGFLMTRKKE